MTNFAKRQSISQPNLSTSYQIGEADDIVFTRSVVDALLFDVKDKPSSASPSTIDESRRNTSSEKKSRSDAMLIKRGNSKSIKSIHKIPFAHRESRSAPSDAITNDQDLKVEKSLNKLPIGSSLVLIQDTVTGMMVKNENVQKTLISERMATTSMMVKNKKVQKVSSQTLISERKASTRQIRNSKIFQCWDGHSQHIKSHSNNRIRVPKEELSRPFYTSVVDVNSQYDFVSQGRNSKLKDMTWVHRMIIADFEEEAERVTYDQSCYFVKKKPLAPKKQKLHYSKTPLKLGKTLFDADGLREQDVEKLKDDTVQIINLENPSNTPLKSKHSAFWELKNDLIPQRLYLDSSSHDDYKKTKDCGPNLKSGTFIENHDQKPILKRSVLKKAIVELQTCVESEGWDTKLEIQSKDCHNYKSELIFNQTQKVKGNHKIDLSETLKQPPIYNELMAIGCDIFKSPKLITSRPIIFSDAVKMIQFIVEVNRRIAIFQRVVREKMPSFKQKNVINKYKLTEKQSKIWKGFDDSVNLLRKRFPDQFDELDKSPRRIPLQSQFEKIINLT